jgi:cyclomaltodextrinase / maltogenic alpha-amylase / neopullulanase
MSNLLSETIARKLRPKGPFHLPPPAQPLDSTVTLTLENVKDEPLVCLRDMARNHEWQVCMEPDAEQPGTWNATIQLPMRPTVVTYYFQAGKEQILEKRQVEGHNKPVYGRWEKLPYKIAVYDPDRMPADWTQGMIVYQIFPDRFARAQSDESVRAKMRGVYGLEPVFRTWGEAPELPPLGRDFFGGDLAGITSKLDYLEELGIQCIYLNPIFEAASNHRYETIDFMKIDPMLGTDEDFDELLQGAHSRNIKVILDAVFNHCSSDSIYFDISGKQEQITGIPGAARSRQSPYFRWFRFSKWPDEYAAWHDFDFMPEFVECPEMEAYFLAEDGVTESWLHRGIDGWRTDVTADNSDEFWRRFRDQVDDTKPGAWLIAEEWRDATHYMLGDMFNGTMNYRFAWAVRGFLGTDDLTPSELDDRLQTWMRDTPEPAIKSQMNLLDSHDTNRSLTACGSNLNRFRQMIAFQLAYPGAPTIYYGNEIGLEGKNAEDGRRCFTWDKLDSPLHRFIKQALQFRKRSRALRIGDTTTVIADDARRIYGFSRETSMETVYALFNASDAPIKVALPVDNDGIWTDALGTHPRSEVHEGSLTLTLQPRSAAWYCQDDG